MNPASYPPRRLRPEETVAFLLHQPRVSADVLLKGGASIELIGDDKEPLRSVPFAPPRRSSLFDRLRIWVEGLNATR
jgi:hypothetical protein